MPASTAEKLPPTAGPHCGTYAGYQAHRTRGESTCDLCKVAVAAYMRERRELGTYREDQRQSAHRSDKSGRSQRTRTKYRNRTDEAADADFNRLNPDGLRACRSCGELLPMVAFSRSRMNADGRQLLCNDCSNGYRRLKRDRKLHAYWLARGIDPHVCIYCLDAPASDIEHVMPKALGGSDDFSNLAPSCLACNRGPGGKHDTHPIDWLTVSHPERLDTIVALFPHITKETAHV